MKMGCDILASVFLGIQIGIGWLDINLYKFMDSSQPFRFSGDQLKKVNLMLPKGYKFATKEDMQKQKMYKAPKKKFIPPSVAHFEPLPPPPPLSHSSHSQPKVKADKEECYEPDGKKVIIQQPTIPTDEGPAGSTAIFLARMQKHTSYVYFLNHIHQEIVDIQSSLKRFEEKVAELGEAYNIEMYSADLSTYFLEIYKTSSKTSSDYRQAADLDDWLHKLLKLQRIDRRGDIGKGQGGRKKAAPVKLYQPLSSYKMATPRQKRQLGMMMRKLSSQNIYHIVNMMFESSEVKEYSFDLDNIHIKKFRELEEYVKKCMEKIIDWDPKLLEDEELSNESQFVIENDCD